jgi:hypothetical protein
VGGGDGLPADVADRCALGPGLRLLERVEGREHRDVGGEVRRLTVGPRIRSRTAWARSMPNGRSSPAARAARAIRSAMAQQACASSVDIPTTRSARPGASGSDRTAASALRVEGDHRQPQTEPITVEDMCESPQGYDI